MDQLAFDLGPSRRHFTVGELTARIRELLASEFSGIWVTGEISGMKEAPSGHIYFTLKDNEAQLRCACFRMTARYLKFKPRDGVAVLVRGRVDVYDARGEYQLIVDAVEPLGYGALQLAFEQLKKKLEAEGLFDRARKRPLPPLPARIGIVTSPAGAAIQDMLNILARRFPGRHIRIWPALVQGEGSIEQVTRGIEYFSRTEWAEVVIVARGGGSLEDLWTFNTESVARAIAACAVPVISAIGHETDFTIADFVADLRAPTPSAAAELVVPTRASLLGRLDAAQSRLAQSVRWPMARLAQRSDELDFRMRDRWRRGLAARRRALESLTTRLRGLDVRLQLARTRSRLDAAEAAMLQRTRLRLSRAHGRLTALQAHLRQLSPLAILERGYAIVENEAGQVVKSPAQAPAGSGVQVRLAEGQLRARVL